MSTPGPLHYRRVVIRESTILTIRSHRGRTNLKTARRRDLVLGGYFDVAVRDVVKSAAAFVLARLLELHYQERAGSQAADRPRRTATA